MRLEGRRGLVEVPPRHKRPPAPAPAPGAAKAAAGQPSAELKREPEPAPSTASAEEQDVTRLQDDKQQEQEKAACALAFMAAQRRRSELEQRDEQLQAAFAVARVMARRKRPAETFHEFAAALRSEGKTHVIPEPFYVVAFINGVGHKDTAKLLGLTKPVDLDAAASAAICLRRSDGASPPQASRPPRTATATATRRKRQRANTWSGSASHKRARSGACYLCDEQGHYARECPTRWDP